VKNNIKNERVKRRYFRWLKEAKGLADASIYSIEKAIWVYEDFVNYEDYGQFNNRKATAFKKWLEERRFRGKPTSDATQYHILRNLKGFFTWLSGQAGYKSKVSYDNISYLSLEKKKVRGAISPKKVKYPSLDYVKQLASSIEIKTEIDRRDRALIAFLLLSGMRDKAVATLPLGCFDRDKLEVHQYSSEGVETKFGKSFVSYLFRFDDMLLSYIADWAEYLEKVRLFGSTDPLFPRSKVEQGKGAISFESNSVEPVFWKGTGSIRTILKTRAEAAGLEYFRPHSFRHLAVYLATRTCRTMEQFKAVSQNFGHEYVGTTMVTYGRLDDHRIGEIIGEMDFEEKGGINKKSEILEKVIRELEGLK
jgi:integrase